MKLKGSLRKNKPFIRILLDMVTSNDSKFYMHKKIYKNRPYKFILIIKEMQKRELLYLFQRKLYITLKGRELLSKCKL